MGYGVSLQIWGDYALFTRPEMKAERVSYDVITPSAARGVLEAIYWHPGLVWHVDAITVLHPIRFDTVRRNELGSKIAPRTVTVAMNGGPAPHQFIQSDRQQRASLLLRDVSYIVDAHFSLRTDKISAEDTKEKFYNIFLRRARAGQCFHQPYLGCREFPAFFRLLEGDAQRPESCYVAEENRDLGWMLWGMEYMERPGKKQMEYDYHPKFFRAQMQHGVIHVPKEVNV